MAISSSQSCSVCGRPVGRDEGMPVELVRDSILERIRRDHSGFTAKGVICPEDLHRYRMELVEDVLADERGELSRLDADVLEALEQHELVAADVDREFDRNLSFGQRVADRVAEFGGSWGFILSFGGILVAWIVVNTAVLAHRPFDPYPFILLNLVLSCLAALQAPVIMMSQNRQEAKDRLRSEHDYQVNLKAELEIRLLSARFDHILGQQWNRLMEIQKIQLDLMEEIATHRRTVEAEGEGRE